MACHLPTQSDVTSTVTAHLPAASRVPARPQAARGSARAEAGEQAACFSGRGAPGLKDSAVVQQSLPRRPLLSALAAACWGWGLPGLARAGSADGDAAGSRGDPAVLAALQKALRDTIDKGKAPVLLRLAFHDAATFSESSSGGGGGGANGSVQYELKRPESTGLNRGWRVIERVREALKGTPAEGRVSDADLIAFAGAHAVALTGGPQIPLSLGRLDAGRADPEGRLPPETLSAPEQRAAFAALGFSPRELVALSGAHTLGNKGFGEPLRFDNAYYTAALAKPWDDPKNEMRDMIGIASDRVLAADPVCQPFIEGYAADQGLFFRDFAAAYTKLTSLGARWG